jgi:hypothetical protein
MNWALKSSIIIIEIVIVVQIMNTSPFAKGKGDLFKAMYALMLHGCFN